MQNKIVAIISEYQGIPATSITPNSMLVQELGLSSFDVVSLIGRFEDEFDIEIPDRKIKNLKTIADIADMIESMLADGE